MKSITIKLVAFVLLLWVHPAYAQLTTSPIFGSDMVLQRNAAVPVFGTANPGESVSVQFQNQVESTQANGNGDWQVYLSSMSASSSPSSMTISSGNENIVLTGVQVGEVWLCSGQSNMAWELSQSDDGAAAIAESGNYNIRLFRMDAGNGPETSQWEVSNPQNSPDFSAVGWWMGKELSQWFGNVPIGLIQATHDGTAIDQWQHTSGGVGTDYDAMVKPIQPYAIKGAAWYQGESNGGDSDYDVKLTNMIAEWRSDWGLPDLHFGIVQLAGSGSGGARLGQFVVSQTVANTFLVVIADLPGGKQLHPTLKEPVGIRTAIGARGSVYGDNITYSGPIPDEANSFVSGSTVVMNWTSIGNGLTTSDGQSPSTFKIAASSGQYKSANATIVGDSIHLSSSMVSDPTRVRYQYGSVGNLVNDVNIPIAGGADAVTELPSSIFEMNVGPGGGGNQSPIAQFNYSATDLAVVFDASGSSDPDGTIAAWDWDFGDGAADSGEIVSHTYASPGSYSVTLTVTDDMNATATDNQTVTVFDGSGGGVTMHVQSINAYSQGVGGGNKQGVANVTVHDNLENPVSGATVTATFSGTFNETVSAVTDASGVATLLTTGTAKGNVSVSACVDNITHGSLSYDSAQNDVSCSP